MKPSFCLPLFSLLLLSIPIYSQDMNERNSPCADVVQTAALTSCFADAKDKADTELNAVYKQVHKQLEGSDAANLVKTQRLWLQYRDANCSAERDLYEGGTAKYAVYYACLDSLTRARTRELQITYAVRLKE